MYAFVRREVRQRAMNFLEQRKQGISVSEALLLVAAERSNDPIGLSFGELP